ncbi:MAG: hypothetical protein DI637_08185 [Citromicrobium sp.]|nr:MAG: hypothetical protein DI637_08185 [Citromicrobium sp.]
MAYEAKNWLVLTDQLISTIGSKGEETKSEWHALSDHWRKAFPSKTLDSIQHAAYVIWISNPFTFDYGNLQSPVAYIGKGMAHARFKNHISSKLLPTLEALQGARFDFWVLECLNDDQAKSSEADMIRFFEETYGRLPIFNKNRPSGTSVAAHDDCWLPLDRRRYGGNRTWAVRPLDSN